MITDFTVNPADSAAFIDRIDLSEIDAQSSTPGIQHFSFTDGTVFTAEGQIRAVQAGTNTLVLINTKDTATPK